MARPRGQSVGEGLRTAHSVSLKVLRLSRPSLHYQYALPSPSDDIETTSIHPKASLAYAAADPTSSFVISPVLTLPESFRSAYVGEEFACTLCANNEVRPEDTSKSISGIRILAEMQMPLGETLTLDLEDAAAEAVDGAISAPGSTIQKILRLNLSEPGQHVLAVTVTYTEHSTAEDGSAQGARVRTFRKLYQFVAQPLINVKTKTGDVGVTKAGRARYVLEAQLQNLGERMVCLEAVSVDPTSSFSWRSLNWDAFSSSTEPAHAPILNPNDTLQVAFVLEEKSSSDTVQPPEGSDDRVTLGQLTIQWRSAMGDRGSLKTSMLTGRRR